MGIPIEIGIYFSIISFFLLIFIGMLLFINPDFNKAVFALILCFVNGIVSIVATVSFLVMDIYGFNASGALVSNVTADMYPLGMIFLGFIYFTIIFAFFAIWIMYKKP